MAMTVQKLLDAAKLIKDIETSTRRPIHPTPFNGIDVICDPNCLADTTERNFPTSRHRSARAHKKLLRRFGSEFRKQPAIYQVMGRIYAHPVLYAELKRQLIGPHRREGS